eukprot:6538992-Pyramimonas_sp.AAC.1
MTCCWQSPTLAARLPLAVAPAAAVATKGPALLLLRPCAADAPAAAGAAAISGGGFPGRCRITSI